MYSASEIIKSPLILDKSPAKKLVVTLYQQSKKLYQISI